MRTCHGVTNDYTSVELLLYRSERPEMYLFLRRVCRVKVIHYPKDCVVVFELYQDLQVRTEKL